MIGISLCMIVKNEEKTLERCLSSVQKAVDQMIIVDTGSTDRTKQIARKFTRCVFDFEWVDDFAAARNFAFSKAEMDYILWLDADDVFKEEDLEKLLELKKTLSSDIDSVTMKYNLAFDEHGNVTSSLRRNRLVKRSNNFRWVGSVHEYLEVAGRIIDSDIAVTHCGDDRDRDRNLNIYMKRQANGEAFSPRDVYYFANELKDHRLFDLAAVYYRKFLEEGKGWVEDNIAACGKLADCYLELGDTGKALAYTLKSFEYGAPRPEFCCRMGYHFLQTGDYSAAVYWYKQAIENPAPANSWGMQNLNCSTWLPHLQLCVCYDRLGMHQIAYHHNEAARHYRPDHPSVIQNKAYLENKLGIKAVAEPAKETANP
ncbi:glycosyltransferase family 2 protein [Paenibacillus sp. VCA1]|uniref:tetratricopeptide repeat-containing glycosyltransferase family 2 protein n=1 Tax=Paenibacillus sp. VCA1 TaxID=3039148 RepID=UPI0028714EA1|nr:glycosyltransferase family 2 protein [Paenibacillus sp. VCA1]MDR9852234.1 glycosyltransferase family 2 protein [Paenibacillus sp. VCA1]